MFGISAFSETAFGSQPSVTDVTVPIAGWGSSTWNTGAWGTNVTLPQASGAVGTATQQTNENVASEYSWATTATFSFSYRCAGQQTTTKLDRVKVHHI